MVKRWRWMIGKTWKWAQGPGRPSAGWLDDNLANYWLNSMKARQRLGSRRFEGFKIQDYSYYHEFLRDES